MNEDMMGLWLRQRNMTAVICDTVNSDRFDDTVTHLSDDFNLTFVQ